MILVLLGEVPLWNGTNEGSRNGVRESRNRFTPTRGERRERVPGGARVCMDNPENWPQPSGLTDEGALLFATAFSSAASKDDDWWNRAEDQAAELIASLQPIPSSEERRQDIVNFVQDLIGICFQDVKVSAPPPVLQCGN